MTVKERQMKNECPACAGKLDTIGFVAPPSGRDRVSALTYIQPINGDEEAIALSYICNSRAGSFHIGIRKR
jgi:hypothetical protein